MAVLLLLVFGAAVSAIQAIRAQRLISSALWLAGVSALIALMLYLLGATAVAVIELSVGAGLVTVLFVFAISMAGEDLRNLPAVVPRPLGWVLTVGATALLAWMLLPVNPPAPAVAEADFTQMLWEARGLDMLLQVVLIFAGVMGMLGLLVTERAPAKARAFQILPRDATPPEEADDQAGEVYA